MGSYLNPGSSKFSRSLNSKIYVDKSGLIDKTNALIDTEQNCICICRPRRFGKSMALNMLAAYYGCDKDTDVLFRGLKISSAPSYREHLNQYNCITLNIQEFLSGTNTADEMIDRIKHYLTTELMESYPLARYLDAGNFTQMMKDVYAAADRPFIILIDEWDCIFREYKDDFESQKKYLDFLRMWLKDQEYVGLAYMTGILPIKKYSTHSALNMFSEYAMTNPGGFAEFFGFTRMEVKGLCEQHGMSFEETGSWCDGYTIGEREAVVSIYNPKSVVEAMLHHSFRNYWNLTETYEALKVYIQMNFDGLREAVITMLAGGIVRVNTGKFKIDMVSFSGKDDVLTLLIHLGYLTYDFTAKTATIPNREVTEEYINAIEDIGWNEVIRSFSASRELLEVKKAKSDTMKGIPASSVLPAENSDDGKFSKGYIAKVKGFCEDPDPTFVEQPEPHFTDRGEFFE